MTMKTLGQKGFTLVELILYIAIASMIVVFASVFIHNLLESKTKNQAILEVEEQGVQTLNLVTQTIRNAQSLNSPAAGELSSELSLAVDDAAKSPTVLDVSQKTLRIKEGDSEAVPLTSNRVWVDEIRFRNLSRDGTPGIVRIEFTLSYASSGQSQAYQYSKTFYASAALR
jgi:prepilin-type N-terminal cleavage/methylation domain-containing protein